MLIINLSILFGYILPNSSHRNLKHKKNELNLDWKKRVNINKIILICSIISILSSLNVVLAFYPNSSEILYYLKNPGHAYENTKFITRNLDSLDNGGGFGSNLSILMTLLSGTKYIVFTFSILYWKQLGRLIRLLSVFTFVTYFVASFLIGAMITIGTIIMSMIPIFIIFMKKKRLGVGLRFKKSKKLKTLIPLGIGCFTILFFMSNRVSDDNDLFEGIKVLGFYISHGYVGLDLSLGIPFEPTYGFTSFRGISEMFVKYLGAPDLFQNSYLVRNQSINNYPALSVWSTIFPWLASDFSYYLIPFIMVIISYQFSLIWNKTIRTGNPYGYLLLGQLFIFWLMIPANNQLFHTLSNSASFILIYYLYVKSKKYYTRFTK